MEKEDYGFAGLVEIMARLRAPDGCPWDREQTHLSIVPCRREEAAELAEALAEGDDLHIREELGDVLMQVLFHAQIASETGRFGVADVIADVSRKLVTRHPHVFGEGDKLRTAGQVVTQWEKIKKGEKDKQDRKSQMDGIPVSLPALQYAAKMQTRAARVGFDWPDAEGVFDKIGEEIAEVRRAREARDAAPEEAKDAAKAHLEEELGDLLFSVVNLCRHLDAAPEEALLASSRKFARRFRAMEALCGDLKSRTPEELDSLWRRVKAQEPPQER